jgi:hypothetical protein
LSSGLERNCGGSDGQQIHDGRPAADGAAEGPPGLALLMTSSKVPTA